jgi:hypothetical protein
MKQETLSFINFINPDSGLIFNDEEHDKYPLKYYNVINGEGIDVDENKSYYGFVYLGEAVIKIKDNIQSILPKDSYFSHHGEFTLCGNFKAVIIEVITSKGIYLKERFKAMTAIGGVVEDTGRLKYIDGCTDSLLIPPVKKGNPCLNHLHFPKDIRQTPHTHPSHRVGLVIRGQGKCVTPFGDLPLNEGCIFVIKEYDGLLKAVGLDGKMYDAGTHKFDTNFSSMDVIAFHPDSDFGPEDEFHPMINRTIVNGISAKDIDQIRTK